MNPNLTNVEIVTRAALERERDLRRGVDARSEYRGYPKAVAARPRAQQPAYRAAFTRLAALATRLFA